MKNLNLNLLILVVSLLLSASCSHFKSDHSIREPNSIMGTNYQCAKLVSMLFPNPYNKNYPLKDFSYDEAVEAFHENIAKRSAGLDANGREFMRLKVGSQPFMRLQKPPKQAPTVVLLHGYSDSAGSMREIAEMYYQRGFNVVAPLYSDHGLVEQLQKQALNNSSLDVWRQDVDFALSIAKGLSNDGKVHLGGYSMGSTLAIDSHLRHPGLIKSMSLYAPLLRENGVIIQAGVHLINWLTYFKSGGSFFKKVDETDFFYKRMTYRQTLEMHRLTRQIQPWVLNHQESDIPIAMLRTDREAETTVDDKIIDAMVERKGITHQYIHDNTAPDGTRVENPVLHRDLPNSTLNSNGEANQALFMIQQTLNGFLDSFSW